MRKLAQGQRELLSVRVRQQAVPPLKAVVSAGLYPLAAVVEPRVITIRLLPLQQLLPRAKLMLANPAPVQLSKFVGNRMCI